MKLSFFWRIRLWAVVSILFCAVIVVLLDIRSDKAKYSIEDVLMSANGEFFVIVKENRNVERFPGLPPEGQCLLYIDNDFSYYALRFRYEADSGFHFEEKKKLGDTDFVINTGFGRSYPRHTILYSGSDFIDYIHPLSRGRLGEFKRSVNGFFETMVVDEGCMINTSSAFDVEKPVISISSKVYFPVVSYDKADGRRSSEGQLFFDKNSNSLKYEANAKTGHYVNAYVIDDRDENFVSRLNDNMKSNNLSNNIKSKIVFDSGSLGCVFDYKGIGIELKRLNDGELHRLTCEVCASRTEIPALLDHDCGPLVENVLGASSNHLFVKWDKSVDMPDLSFKIKDYDLEHGGNGKFWIFELGKYFNPSTGVQEKPALNAEHKTDAP